MKLNLGCGSNRLEGWENHDADVDITQRLPWTDNSVEMILAEHVVEHVSGPEALRFFDECHRILQPGGVLRICMPVILGNERPLSREHARDLVLGHGHLAAYDGEIICKLLELAGFTTTTESYRKDCDGHWRAIGVEKDGQETYRVEATK
jgi:hypothetical protein